MLRHAVSRVATVPMAAPRAVGVTLRGFASGSGSEEASFEFPVPFQTHQLEDYLGESKLGLANSTTCTKDELMTLYTQMLTMRHMEVAADACYKNKEIRGFCHLYDGQEAVCAGLEAAMDMSDHVVTAYRDHAHALLRGCSVESIMAELMGKATGCSRGKGGSMHMYNAENNFYGGNGIVGAQIPLGAGIAFAQAYKSTGQVTLCYYGDGAANQGQIFEAMNMASLWKLPLILICENNRYGMGTSTKRSSANDEYYTRGDRMIPGIRCDGMDPLCVREVGRFAKRFVNECKSPLLLEMDTYRYHGHSMSDPGISYRSRDEVSDVRQTRDPLLTTRQRLIDAGWATMEECKALEKSIRKSVDADVKAARAAAMPDLPELYSDVLYGRDSQEPIRQAESNSFYTAHMQQQ